MEEGQAGGAEEQDNSTAARGGGVAAQETEGGGGTEEGEAAPSQQQTGDTTSMVEPGTPIARTPSSSSAVGTPNDDGGGSMTLPTTLAARSSSFPSRAIAAILRMPTAADALASHSHPICLPPGMALTHGKYAALALPAVYLLLTALWVPLWLLSFLLTELGVYALILASVYKAGRALVRLIAFPGSSHRVYGEIETEFARYSVRMLDAACGVVVEAASAVIVAGGGPPPPDGSDPTSPREDGTAPNLVSPIEALMSYPASHFSSGDLVPLWSRARGYRDRVLAVYSDVLGRLLDEVPTPPASSTSEGPSAPASAVRLNECGNNPLVGHIGNLPETVSPEAIDDGATCSSLLRSVLHDMTALERSCPSIVTNTAVGGSNRKTPQISLEARRAAVALLRSTTELRDLLPSMKPPPSPSDASGDEAGTDDDEDDDDEECPPHHDDDENVDAVRRRLRLRQQAARAGSDGDGGGGNGNGGGPSTPMEAVRTGAASVLPMLDPPLHGSVFGLDVLRGCVLARYRGARQLWVRQGKGGRWVDVMHLPAWPPGTTRSAASNGGGRGGSSRRRAVLYCNPNAGLMEVATGMSLVGGNVTIPDSSSGSAEQAEGCWADFYTRAGYDVYLFNYGGFGRSGRRNGGASNSSSPSSERTPGTLGRIGRIVRGSFWDFCPSPKSMKADALAVARHIVANEIGHDGQLVVHGESIGGMAAASAARGLSNDHQVAPRAGGGGVCPPGGSDGAASVSRHPTLLICDRSFCNLEAVAERLVGGWTGGAIRALTPFWSTDVAGDFMAARCAKVVANDAADSIIADASSLKSGLAVSREMRRGSTWGVNRMVSAPLEYRMADWEDVGVSQSRFAVAGPAAVLQPPVWPADKHVAPREAYHFAACARRVGKVATSLRKEMALYSRQAGGGGSRSSLGSGEGGDEGIEITELGRQGRGSSGGNPSVSDVGAALPTQSDEDRILEAWKALGCCDGMCGAPLGSAVRDGYDCTVTWLCSTVTYGAQVVADAAERRTARSNNKSGGGVSLPDGGNNAANREIAVLPLDFDARPEGYANDESELSMHPMPVPGVISVLKNVCNDGNGLCGVESEVRYCIGMLEYIVARMSAKQVVAESLKIRHMRADSEISTTGCFLNLHCGHNNQYSSSERENLKTILKRAGN